MILDPKNLSDGVEAQVRSDPSSPFAHIQFRLNEPHNRAYGACYNVPTSSEFGAVLLDLANRAKYQPVGSLASNSKNYMPFTIHPYGSDEGVLVVQVQAADVPTFALPFFDAMNGVLRIGFTADAIPDEVTNLI